MKTKWTKAKRAECERYIIELRDLLGLRDWEVKMNWKEDSPEGTCADITPWQHQKRATIRLAPNFLEEPLREQRQTLAHELMHCHLFSIRWAAEESFAEACDSEVAQRIADKMVNAQIELATDSIAEWFAHHLPLPNWE